MTALETTASTPAVSLRSLGKTYTTDNGATVKALLGVSLDIAEGEFISVIGPSGCGKSTLLNVLSGMISEYNGDAAVYDQPIKGPRDDVGIVFQQDSTFPWRSVLRNVTFSLEARGIKAAKRDEIARKFINMVGLSGFEHAYPRELSGGMRQRVALARTLAVEPKVLLLDEPFGALDELTRSLLGEELLKIWQRLGQTVVLITHSISEAVQLSDRVVVMSHRPATIKRIVEVNAPRPRQSDFAAQPEYISLIGEIWNDLHEEVTSSMMQEEELILERQRSTRTKGF